MSSTCLLAGGWLVVLVSALAACSAAPDADLGHGKPAGSSTGGSGAGGNRPGGGGGSVTLVDPTKLPAPPGCGDGILTPDEACDDGNQTDDDGCRANCLGVYAGFTCPIPGEACRPFARCGDGVVAFPEQCDDGSVAPGDGCSATCKVEVGSKCAGAPSVCSPSTCGDGVIEGAETCDDGNTQPFDGCSGDCVGEPNCDAGACSSACGDGIVLLPEQCDDGNSLPGDGCSATCQLEAGYECTQDTECEKLGGACVLRIPAIFRDFKAAHSDFEEGACAGVASVTPGLVGATLKDGKPTPTAGNRMCTTNLSQWYVDLPGTNTSLVGEIVLFDNGAGGFVNRYNPDGTQLKGIDGNPFFYPADAAPGADLIMGAAVSGAPYTDGTTLTEEVYVPLAAPVAHNFGFTSEVAYWFAFDASASATLQFNGDDDFWVFINGKLALDLGGVHSTQPGEVTIDASAAAAFGLEDGKVYQIKVFHAERQAFGSTFKLTLSGFSVSRSDCNAKCGDGLIGAGEECDDGVNDGGYNECMAGCKLGSYCGDGVLDPGEDCDDGNRLDGDGCGSACRNLVVK